MGFKRENKFLVLKSEDIEKYLDSYLKGHLESITAVIEESREEVGKKTNSYIVVNEDEPYAEQVWALIQAHWEEEEQERMVNNLCKKAEGAPKGSVLNP